MRGTIPLKQRAYLSMMAQKRVDGLLVMCSYPEPLLAMLEEYRHPNGGDGLG